MLRKAYDWLFAMARSRHATTSLAAVSFAESSFFPLPPDIMLAPMILARPDKAYFYAGLCTAASVLGGLLGYAIGFYLTDLGQQLLYWMGHSDGLAQFQRMFDQWGMWIILIKGLTPVPYKLVTIASGLAHFHLGVFIAASVVTRGGRFFLTAWVLKRFGPKMLEVVEKNLGLATVAMIGLLVGGVLLLKLF